MNANHKKIVLKTCIQPSADAKAICKALNYKNKPLKKKKYCVTRKLIKKLKH